MAATHAALDAVVAELSSQGWLKKLAAVGHRVVHGAERFAPSVVITPRSSPTSRRATSWPHCTIPPRYSAFGSRSSGTPTFRMSQWSTPHSTRPCRRRRISTRCRCRCTGTTASVGTASMAPAIALLLSEAVHDARPRSDRPWADDGSSRQRRLRHRGAGRAQRRHHMGMTPLEGLVMGTRSGDVDAGAVHAPDAARPVGRGRHGHAAQPAERPSRPVGIVQRLPRTGKPQRPPGHAGAILALDVFVHRLARAHRRPGHVAAPSRCRGVHRRHRRERGLAFAR